ncbi:MAG: Cd(II)/Pb(II)-responsive transcriptional regulator [Lysobacterales bacterium]
MKIGALAKATGTSVETIRFYERERLLPLPARTDGNYRIYRDAHAERLNFIRNCRSLDMALDEIGVLLRFRDLPIGDCGEVNALLDEHIEHVVKRIGELKTLEKQLKVLRQQCHAVAGATSCGILRELSSPRGSSKAKGRPHHIGGTHR